MVRTLARRAFTLIELIVTLVILAIILAVLAITVLGPVMASAHEKQAGSTLDRVQTANQLLARDWGSYSSWAPDLSSVGADLTIRNSAKSRGPAEVSLVVGSAGTLAMAVAIDAKTCVFRRVASVESGGGSSQPDLDANALCTAASALPATESALAQTESMKTTTLNN